MYIYILYYIYIYTYAWDSHHSWEVRTLQAAVALAKSSLGASAPESEKAGWMGIWMDWDGFGSVVLILNFKEIQSLIKSLTFA